MECTQVRELMNAALSPPRGRIGDGSYFAHGEPGQNSVPAESAAATWMKHVDECTACAEYWADLQTLDSELRAVTAPHREAAARLAERVVPSLTESQPFAETPAASISSAAPSASRDRSLAWSNLFARFWLGISSSRFISSPIVRQLATLAAGFLLAVLVFRPWEQPAPLAENPPPPDHSVAVDPPPPVARLVVATGEVSIRPTPRAAWSVANSAVVPAAQAGAVSCAPGTALRTEPGVRCEVQTVEGCVIRMNDDSQITVHSARSIELHAGQIWCSAPNDVPMEVIAPADENASATNAPPAVSWTFRCEPNASLISTVAKQDGIRLTAARGDVTVRSGDNSKRLPPGQTVALRDGQFAELSRHDDALLAGTWINSLLIRKGHTDPELLARVDDLLAKIGQAKAAVLYEQELRSLGEHAVLPLLRYVQSSLSADARGERLRAMRIAADLAPAWAVGELIPLLDDKDEEIRVAAAAALLRLTGEDHGRQPMAWRGSPAECSPTVSSWKNWWQENQLRYPSPDFAKSIPQPVPKSFKKA